MNLIELGVPGAGKGTQAKLLSEHFGLEHISSGEELRKASQTNPEIAGLLSTGQLLPFEMVLEVIVDKIKNSPEGFILDGTPRDLVQAEHMDKFFAEQGIVIDHVLYYYLPDEIAVDRLMKRAHHEHRSDDNEQTIQKRLVIYHRETEPIVEHYRKQLELIEIDARPSIEEIFADTLKKLS